MKCRELLQDVLDVQQVLLTTSCVHALEMAALLLIPQALPGTFGCLAAQSFHETKNFPVARAAPCSSTTRPSPSRVSELDDGVPTEYGAAR